jgi:hypothetical protein
MVNKQGSLSAGIASTFQDVIEAWGAEIIILVLATTVTAERHARKDWRCRKHGTQPMQCEPEGGLAGVTRARQRQSFLRVHIHTLLWYVK